MNQDCFALSPTVRGRTLTRCYVQAFLWYLLGMIVLWTIGIEGIYGSPMPFYALVAPALTRGWTGHLLSLVVSGAFCCGIMVALPRMNWLDQEPSRRAVKWFLVGLVAFAIAFPVAVAMIRGGLSGISQSYERQAYEYAGDIGSAGSIPALFSDYLKLRPYLSMHAKVHPPGPIALLWILSYVAGREPLALSIATIMVGALGIVPLYFWAAELTGKRVALTACLVYSLMPTYVLFSATSADIMFMPFVLATLYFFVRSLTRGSLMSALAAGAGYAACTLLSFSLFSLGVFFAAVGLWQLSLPGRWRRVVVTALIMAAAFVAVHAVVHCATGFDMMACFRACKEQFELDQLNLDQMSPRYPAWVWRLANPVCWFYFIGIPTSLLFLWRLFSPETEASGSHKRLFIACVISAALMSLLYLGRGEGERSAMYIFPLVVLPAAHLLEQLGRTARSLRPLAATLLFLAAQVWFTESVFYTFW